jgi:hypothetical protein
LENALGLGDAVFIGCREKLREFYAWMSPLTQCGEDEAIAHQIIH